MNSLEQRQAEYAAYLKARNTVNDAQQKLRLNLRDKSVKQWLDGEKTRIAAQEQRLSQPLPSGRDLYMNSIPQIPGPLKGVWAAVAGATGALAPFDQQATREAQQREIDLAALRVDKDRLVRVGVSAKDAEIASSAPAVYYVESVANEMLREFEPSAAEVEVLVKMQYPAEWQSKNQYERHRRLVHESGSEYDRIIHDLAEFRQTMTGNRLRSHLADVELPTQSFDGRMLEQRDVALTENSAETLELDGRKYLVASEETTNRLFVVPYEPNLARAMGLQLRFLITNGLVTVTPLSNVSASLDLNAEVKSTLEEERRDSRYAKDRSDDGEDVSPAAEPEQERTEEEPDFFERVEHILHTIHVVHEVLEMIEKVEERLKRQREERNRGERVRSI